MTGYNKVKSGVDATTPVGVFPKESSGKNAAALPKEEGVPKGHPPATLYKTDDGIPENPKMMDFPSGKEWDAPKFSFLRAESLKPEKY